VIFLQCKKMNFEEYSKAEYVIELLGTREPDLKQKLQEGKEFFKKAHL